MKKFTAVARILIFVFLLFTCLQPVLADTWKKTPMQAFREEGWAETSLYKEPGWWLTLFGANDMAAIEFQARKDTYDFSKAKVKPWLKLVLDDSKTIRLGPDAHKTEFGGQTKEAVYAFDTAIRIPLEGNKHDQPVRDLFKAIADAKHIEVTFPTEKGEKTVTFNPENGDLPRKVFDLKN